MDTNWYLDINRFARETSWAHGFMTAYAGTSLAPVGAGLLFIALLVLAGCLSARREPESMPAAAWAGLGALVALGTGLALAGWVGRARPYWGIAHVELLLPRSHSYGFPSLHAVVAGAAVCGLALAKRWLLAGVGLLAALLLAFSRVYVGAEYPGDVGAGLVLGVLVVLVLWPLARPVLVAAANVAARGPLAAAVATGQARSGRARLTRSRKPHPVDSGLPGPRAMEALRKASEAARANAQRTAQAEPVVDDAGKAGRNGTTEGGRKA